MNLHALGLSLLVATATVGSMHSARADTPAAVDPATRERSRTAFRKGVAQAHAQDWPGARASFEEAWSLVQHPSILLNLGIARLKTDDPVLAEQDLARFLSDDAGSTPEEQASAREGLVEARAKIGTLRIAVTPASARVLVDGKPVALRAGDGIAEVRLRSGKHPVAVEAEGFAPAERTADVAPKLDTDLKIALVARGAEREAPVQHDDRDGPSTRRIVGWSLAGLSGVALVTSGILGLRAFSLSSDYEDRLNPASFQKPDVKDSGIAARTGADVAFVIALLAGTGAVVLLFTHLGEPSANARKLAAKSLLPQSPALVRW